MKERFLHEIQLSSHITINLHSLPHPHGMPQMSKAPGVGWPIIEENSSASGNTHISSKIDSIRIQFEAGSK